MNQKKVIEKFCFLFNFLIVDVMNSAIFANNFWHWKEADYKIEHPFRIWPKLSTVYLNKWIGKVARCQPVHRRLLKLQQPLKYKQTEIHVTTSARTSTATSMRNVNVSTPGSRAVAVHVESCQSGVGATARSGTEDDSATIQPLDLSSSQGNANKIVTD